MACKCNTKPCNCNDVPGVTPDGYHELSTAGATNLAPTSYYPANAVVYPTTNAVPYQTLAEVPINTGSSAVEAYQALVLLQTNPTCIQNTPNCQSPVGVIVSDATQTNITVVWVGNETATGYRIKAVTGGVPVFQQDFSSTTTAAMITGLAPATDYEVSVGTICDSSPVTTCDSVTILVTTPGLL
jgi:hypothetical protein